MYLINIMIGITIALATIIILLVVTAKPKNCLTTEKQPTKQTIPPTKGTKPCQK